MWPQYDSWQKSSHHAVAGCADCHLPPHGIRKYIEKGRNGFNHSWAFTFQDFHEPIQITRRNANTLHDNCVHCHETTVSQMGIPHEQGLESVSCVHCHAGVGHGPR
jgi:cytochrome c nitrite reductase small subunit